MKPIWECSIAPIYPELYNSGSTEILFSYVAWWSINHLQRLKLKSWFIVYIQSFEMSPTCMDRRRVDFQGKSEDIYEDDHPLKSL